MWAHAAAEVGAFSACGYGLALLPGTAASPPVVGRHTFRFPRSSQRTPRPSVVGADGEADRVERCRHDVRAEVSGELK